MPLIFRLLLAVLLSLPAFDALADTPLDAATLAHRLADVQHLSGQFVQRRYLADLDTTLESEGRYDYRRGERMVWRLERPVSETLTISSSGIERQGHPVEGLPAEVSRLILQLLDGDFAALQARFAITFEGSLQSWRAELAPRDQQLSEYLERVELKGGAQVTEVGLWLDHGDRQSIELIPGAAQ